MRMLGVGRVDGRVDGDFARLLEHENELHSPADGIDLLDLGQNDMRALGRERRRLIGRNGDAALGDACAWRRRAR